MTYNELRSTRGEKMRQKYLRAMEAGKKDAAWLILRNMMRYKLIPREEALLEIRQHFKSKRLVQSETFDYRHVNSNDRLPDNLLFDCPISTEVKVTSMEHWIIRRELQYVGDQLAPDRTLRFSIVRALTGTKAYAVLDDLESLYRSLSGMELKHGWRNCIDNGNCVVYRVTLGNDQQYVIRHLGYLVCQPIGKTMTVHILLDNKQMLEQNIDIIDTYEAVIDSILDGFVELGVTGDTLKVKGICDYKLIGKKQRAERKPVMTKEQLAHMRESEYAREQLENEAARLHITVDELKEMKERTAEVEKSEAEKLKQTG